MIYWAAITLGLASSLHCIGMCGPLAFVLPRQHQSTWKVFLGGLEYNFGRILTYGILGLFFGLLGKGLLLGQVQQIIAIVFGVILILACFFGFSIENSINRWPLMAKTTGFIKRQFQQLLSKQGRHFYFGLLNGLLPCGMVYLALAGAITMESITGGVFFMLSFGLGTLPAMLSPFFAGQGLRQKLGPHVGKIQTAAMFIMGIMLISRGLGIEFPEELNFMEMLKNPVMCH